MDRPWRFLLTFLLLVTSLCRASALTDEVTLLRSLSIEARADRVQARLGSMYFRQGRIGEYWQSPDTTIETQIGACADFAVLSFFLLKHSGVEDSDLRLVYVQTSSQERHLVLVVRAAGKSLVVDSASFSSRATLLEERTDLQPLLAFNSYYVYSRYDLDVPVAGYYARSIRQWNSVLTREEFKERHQ
jgi:hypothetical protein